MKIIYRANDGEEFSTEEACRIYEEQIKIQRMNLRSRFFDHLGNPLPINNLADCIESGWYMEIADMKEAQFIAEYAEREVGIVLFEGKPQVGRFYFTENEEWRPIEDLYQKYAKVNNIFEGED
jgi:hypothetical protein